MPYKKIKKVSRRGTASGIPKNIDGGLLHRGLRLLNDDGYSNAVAGIRAGKSKANQTSYSAGIDLRNQHGLLDMLYETSWLDAKIVDSFPNEMTREWISLRSDDVTPEKLEELTTLCELFDIKEKTNQALKWARLYGGCTLIIVVKDGKESKEELDPESGGEVVAINVIDNRRITPHVYDRDALSPTYGEPLLYRISSDETFLEIHRSRIIKFTGVDLPYYAKVKNDYWGASVLTRLQEPIKDVYMVLGSVAELVFEAKYDVIKIPGLSSMLQSRNSQELINILSNINEMKSVSNTVALDSDMEMSQQPYSFAGLPDVIKESFLTISAATDIPEMILTTRNNGGLNASNKEILSTWYKAVESKQQVDMLKPLTYLVNIIARSIGITEMIKVEFNPLSEEDTTEVSTRMNTDATRHATYITNRVVTEDEVRQQLIEDGVYTNLDDTADLDTLFGDDETLDIPPVINGDEDGEEKEETTE